MQARDGPQNHAVGPLQLETNHPPLVTRNEKTVSRSKLMGKPKQKRTSKPAPVTGYHWRKNGAGWDLRKNVYVTSNDGTKKRKQPYVAHLSREAFQEMKRRHKGASLERAITQWVEDHDRS